MKNLFIVALMFVSRYLRSKSNTISGFFAIIFSVKQHYNIHCQNSILVCCFLVSLYIILFLLYEFFFQFNKRVSVSDSNIRLLCVYAATMYIWVCLHRTYNFFIFFRILTNLVISLQSYTSWQHVYQCMYSGGVVSWTTLTNTCKKTQKEKN